jgi:NAD(P)-dependent dehydrogenase (short-subunit alcohol dehydrogenase family)
MALSSFGEDLEVAVIGASGGIGVALTAALAADPSVARVFACSRRQPAAAGVKVHWQPVDIEQEASIAAAARRLSAEAGTLHLVIIATGVLHAGAALQPEKSWATLDAAQLERAFRINSIGPALVAKHFLPLLSRNRRSALAALSARVGSIGDNRLGGWYGYRASKAALNMLVRTAAIELARRNPQALCVALHPGTVDTGLSKPFQRNVSDEKLFAPEFAAARLLSVLDALAPGDSGRVFAWDGSEIPF